MNANFRHRFCAAVFAAVVACAPIAAHAIGDEEFVGPFPSWANVKTNYGAVGDGVADDTRHAQVDSDVLTAIGRLGARATMNNVVKESGRGKSTVIGSLTRLGTQKLLEPL